MKAIKGVSLEQQSSQKAMEYWQKHKPKNMGEYREHKQKAAGEWFRYNRSGGYNAGVHLRIVSIVFSSGLSSSRN